MTPAPRRRPRAVYLFAGPTLHGAALPASWEQVTVCPPARRGSITRLLQTHDARPGPGTEPGCILLADGRYDDVPAVGHRELMSAVAAGWQVWGLSSMGALRAAELHEHGIRGYGRVFAHLLITEAPDDEVAQLHSPAPEYRPVTEALVDLRGYAERLTVDGILTDGQADDAVARLARVWFGHRTTHAFVEACAATAGSDAADHVRTLLPALQAERTKACDLTDCLTEAPWLAT